MVVFAKSEAALQPYRALDGVSEPRRLRPRRVDGRLLRHPGGVHEPGAGAGVGR